MPKESFWGFQMTEKHKKIRSHDESLESESFAQKVLNASLNGIYIYDVKRGQHQFINKQGTTLTGYTLDDLMAMSETQFFELFHPDDRQRIDEHMKKLIHGSIDKLDIEYRFKTKDGKWIWCLSRDRVFDRDEDGSVSQITGTFFDITDRKEFEQALLNKEKIYRELATKMPNGAAFVVDHDLRYVLAEGQALEDVGMSSNDLEGKTIHEALEPELASMYEPHYRSALKGQPYVFEHFSHGRHYETRGTPLRDADGNTYAVLAVSYDITERKKSEQELRESKDRYKELVQNANSAIIRWKRDGTITFFNEYAQTLFGYTAEDIIGRHGRILAPQQDSTKTDRAGLGQKIANDPERFICNVNENVCRDGRRLWIAWTNKAILDKNDNVVEILSVGTDITDQKLIEEALRQRTEILEGINLIFEASFRRQTEKELRSTCLAVAEKVTSSQFGFIGELTAEDRLEEIAISNCEWSACKTENPIGHQITPSGTSNGLEVYGIFERVLRDGKGFYTNDSDSHLKRIGFPPGHPSIDSFLVVPLSHANKTIGMVALANRAGGYRDLDLKSLETLAPAIVQALLGKRSEQLLRESEERFRTMANGLPLIVWVHDASGEQQFVNQTFIEFFGVSAEKLTGEKWKTLIHPDDAEAYINEFLACIQGRNPFNAQVRVRRADNEWRWIESWGKPRYLSTSEFIGYVGTSADITKRKQAEKILIDYNEKLEKEVKSRTTEIEAQYRELEDLNTFIKELSHHTIRAMENDRKTLSKEIHDSIGGSLAAIKLLLESRLSLCERKPPEGFMSLEKIVGHLDEAIKESRRISYQMRPLALEEFSFEQAITETVKRHKEFYPKVEIDLKVNVLDDGIHEEIKTVLYRVIQEALNNIGKHSGADFAKIEIVESRDSIYLKVEDNGCGYDVSKIIDTDQSLQGYGIRSMKERVEMCKGAFQIKSEQGKGTGVSVWIPKYVPVKKTRWQRSCTDNRMISKEKA